MLYYNKFKATLPKHPIKKLQIFMLLDMPESKHPENNMFAVYKNLTIFVTEIITV